MPIITIDGNIGCCKTSILNYFHKNHKIAIDLEPVDSWNEYLDKLYSEPNENSYNFQIKVWLDRCWIQEKSDVLVLMERSPYFIKNVFIEKALEDETITKDQYEILQNLHKKTETLWEPNGYIYLNSKPEQCLQRILKRGRASEHIKLDYVKRIHELHMEKLTEALQKNMNILIIDIENKTISEICNEIINSDLYKRINENIKK
jgi:deoxyadenosine/deoxycytidine kinase